MRDTHGLLALVVVGMFWGCDEPASNGDVKATADAIGGADLGRSDLAGESDIVTESDLAVQSDASTQDDAPTGDLIEWDAEVTFGPPDSPCLQVNPSQVHFGGKKWGEEATNEVTLHSCGTGGEPVEVFEIRLETGNGLSPEFALDLGFLDHVPTPTDPLVLSAGSKVKFQVTYHPQALNPLDQNGAFVLDQGLIKIASSLSSIPIQVPIDGAGVEIECPIAVIKCAEGSSVSPQTMLHLVGSQSVAATGTIVTYEWVVTQPTGSASVFIPSYNFPDPTFEVNVAGLYEFNLYVWDSTGNKSCLAASYEVLVTPDA